MHTQRRTRSVDLLLLVALLASLLTPFLIWKGLLPAPTRWLTHGALAMMMAVAFARMMVTDRVPGVLWAMVGLAGFGVVVALLRGQGITATLWGLWSLFEYPMVGIYAYLLPVWPAHFPQRLRQVCLAILAGEVVVQLGQYLTGEPPGDNLAGTFGQHGVSNLVVFICFVLCLALGQWLAKGRWWSLVAVLGLGAVSSVLGEMKLFPVAAVLLGVLAIGLLILQGEKRWRVLPYTFFLLLAVWGFVFAYDTVVVSARGARTLGSYLDSDTLSNYLDSSRTTVDDGVYYTSFGRNYAFTYGWDSINEDLATILFGFGVGARSESVTLGTSGVGLQVGRLGAWTGTSFLVLLQELGLMGMVALAVFFSWMVVTLYRGVRDRPDSEATELRYALILFTLLWPLWLWYAQTWGHRVPMLLYWTALGYVLGEAKRKHVTMQDARMNRYSLRSAGQ